MVQVNVNLNEKSVKPMKSESSGQSPLSFLYREIGSLLREKKNLESLTASILSHANTLKSKKEVDNFFSSLEDDDNDNHPLGDDLSTIVSEIIEDAMQHVEGMDDDDPNLKVEIAKGLKTLFKEKPSEALLSYFATLDY